MGLIYQAVYEHIEIINKSFIFGIHKSTHQNVNHDNLKAGVSPHNFKPMAQLTDDLELAYYFFLGIEVSQNNFYFCLLAFHLIDYFELRKFHFMLLRLEPNRQPSLLSLLLNSWTFVGVATLLSTMACNYEENQHLQNFCKAPNDSK